MKISAHIWHPSHESVLLRDFDFAVGRVSDVLDTCFGAEPAQALIVEAREEYRRLIPQLPDVGREGPFPLFVIGTAWFLALHRVLLHQGFQVSENGYLVYQLTSHFLDKVPGFARHFLGRVTHSPRHMKNLQHRAAESQQGRYPKGYVFTFLEGNGVDFDYGVDYRQCAAWTFLREQQAPELAPYLCGIDRLYSDRLGWGLTRTTTLAEGGDKCDFRFKRGGATRIASTVFEIEG